MLRLVLGVSFSFFTFVAADAAPRSQVPAQPSLRYDDGFIPLPRIVPTPRDIHWRGPISAPHPLPAPDARAPSLCGFRCAGLPIIRR